MTMTLTRMETRLTRRTRSKIMMESLETRTLMTVALVQSVTAAPVISETITPVGPDQALVMNQFNPATGTLLGANVSYATDAHIFIDSTITNPPNQPDVTGSYSGSVTTTIKVPGDPNFPGVALTSTVTQPLVNFTVVAGPGTQTDGSDGKLVINVDLTDPQSNTLNLTPAQALADGYVGAGTVQGSATGTGSALFSEQGGGNETAATTKFAHSTATLAADYFYIVPATISGRKFQDNDPNSNADNAGDPGLAGWIINITGTTDVIVDNQGNTLVAAGVFSDSTATLAGGVYSFSGLAPGTYTIDEDPINFVNNPGWTHTFGGPYVITVGADGTATAGSLTGNDFGNAPPSTPGGASATIGFWQNKNGQGLIKQAGTPLANWLASNFPNLFGAGDPAFATLNSGPIHFVNLTGKTGANVASTFLRFFNVTGAKTYAQIMSVALAAYFDSVNNNAQAQQFGFGGDLLAQTVNVGSNGAAFGVADNTSITVGQALAAANSALAGQAGIIPANKFNAFNAVFSLINETFDIP